MKSLSSILLFCTTIVLIHCEPPVSNQYLPPQNIPSTSYGAPQQTYGAPQQQNSYNRHGGGGGGGGGGSGPSTAYGAPGITSAIFTKPSSSYGAPSGQHSGYSSNGAGGNRGGGYSGGYNGVNGGGGGGNGGYSYGGGSEESYGPAKYEFQYDVQDYQTGQDFGHMESRDGDRTIGRYYVLLPDGRKQIVNYEADENGYRPIITYEETNNGNGGGGGGYNRNAQPFNGY